jgi:hypothetical protein
MDTRLVRVVCASCEANYRIAAEMVRGKVVDYCCSNCGAVIEVNGTAIELVAPTRPGQDPRERLPRTPEPAEVAPSEASFRMSTTPKVSPPAWRSDTPVGLGPGKPPPPPTSEAFASRRPPVHSSMPPAMSMPTREEGERSTPPPRDVPPLGEAPPAEPRSNRAWMVLATLAAAAVVALIGRAIGSSSAANDASAAQATIPAEPQTPVAARLQPGDYRGTATDPAQPLAVQPRASASNEVSVESLKLEKKKKKAKSAKVANDEPESVMEEVATEAPQAPAPPPFVAPEPPPPAGPDFSKDAAQSALEDAAALAATCRQEDTTAGAVRVAVTFVPTGQATVAVVESGVVRGTPVGSCVAAKFRTAKVPPFSGPKVTVHKTMMF